MGTHTRIVALFLAPIGWALLLAATVTPSWREFAQRPGYSAALFFSDGLWEACVEDTTLHSQECTSPPELMSLSWWPVLQRTLTLLSVTLGGLSYITAHLGVHWWDAHTSPGLTITSGVGIALAGVIYICVVSYKAFEILLTLSNPSVDEGDKFRLGTALYLGWAGGTIEVLSGMMFTWSFGCCFGRDRLYGAQR
ncbi:claudin-3-like [Amia ocellicauda]|uniref:claudin-3-like n=1 Tax=Amia ocellicauda TaxID=2972642 RepID=UPI0034649432